MTARQAHATPEVRGIDAEVFLHPLEFLSQQHRRQEEICDALDELVRNPRHAHGSASVPTVLAYLREELPHHIADEEKDLFPLLERRAPASERIGEILALLHQEHEKDAKLAADTLAGLERLAAQAAMAEPAQFFMSALAFAETQRRHLAWENRVILPLARRHLSQQDCAMLGQRMAARRGLTLPG